MANPRTIQWHGELLWPTDLPDAEIIDLSKVTALGAWCHEWFRRHPGHTVTGGQMWKERFLRAGIPVRWCDDHPTPAGAGVSADEREMLWS